MGRKEKKQIQEGKIFLKIVKKGKNDRKQKKQEEKKNRKKKRR